MRSRLSGRAFSKGERTEIAWAGGPWHVAGAQQGRDLRYAGLGFVQIAQLPGGLGQVALLVVGHCQVGPETVVPRRLCERGAILRNGFVKPAYGYKCQTQIRPRLNDVRMEPDEFLVLANGFRRVPTLLGGGRLLESCSGVCAAAQGRLKMQSATSQLFRPPRAARGRPLNRSMRTNPRAPSLTAWRRF